MEGAPSSLVMCGILVPSSVREQLGAVGTGAVLCRKVISMLPNMAGGWIS